MSTHQKFFKRKNLRIEHILISAGVILGLLAIFFVYRLIVEENRRTLSFMQGQADLIADVVLKSIEFPMMEGEMDVVSATLEMVVKLAGLKDVCLMNPKGEKKFCRNNDLGLISPQYKTVQEALATQERKNGLETVMLPKNGRLKKQRIYVSTIPIYNQGKCFACHGSKQKMLGALSVGLGWDKASQELILEARHIILFSLIAIFILTTFVFIFLYRQEQLAYRALTKTQEELVKNERLAAIGQIAAAVSHDLRNPLTGIKAAAYHLKRKITALPVIANGEIDEALNSIEIESEYANSVITNILSYAKPQRLMYKDVNINNIIEDVLRLLRHMPELAKIEIKKMLQSDLPQIRADDKQIKQVLSNLVLNAVQSMPDGGMLSLTTKKQDDCLEVTITDTGIGIAEEDQNNIFLPFYSKKSLGVGLGLNIVKNVIEAHQGKIAVKSALKQGTIFTITLPLNPKT